MEKIEKNKEKISILASYGLDEKMLIYCDAILSEEPCLFFGKESIKNIKNICFLHKESLETENVYPSLKVKHGIYIQLRELTCNLSRYILALETN